MGYYREDTAHEQRLEGDLSMLQEQVAELQRCIGESGESIIRLAADNDRLEAEVAELESRIKGALNYANRRWSEWGERAMVVGCILNGEDPDEVDQ